jgi:diguanylate cyclase (GGDEF)-like protein
MTLMEELRIRASVDALTGLLNRRRWMERLAEEHARLLRQTDRPYTLLAIDLDHFKTVNDQHGHAIGDAVLRHVAERIQNCLRQTDAAGRLGGEEFIVLLPDTDLAAARPLAERLRATLAQSPLPHPNLPLIVTASLGLAQVLPSDTSYEDVMLRADRALYRAKHLGRNRIEVGEADAPGEPRTAPPPPTGAQ